MGLPKIRISQGLLAQMLNVFTLLKLGTFSYQDMENTHIYLYLYYLVLTSPRANSTLVF